MWAPLRHAMPVDPHELPTCMCGILRRAVEDVMVVAKMPKYRISMASWHEPNGVCKVCMAGAVMARTLRADRKYVYEPSDFESEEYALYAVNSMRVGDMVGAHWQIYGRGVTPSASEMAAMGRARDLIRTDYDKHEDRDHADWEVYLEAADVLKAAGL